MDSVQRTLQNIAHQVLGARSHVDPKMIQLWEHYIGNNVSTYDDFRVHLFKTPEYENMVRELFNVATVEHLGQDSKSNDGLFASFWLNHEKQHNKPIQECIHTFVCKMPEYEVRINQVIKDVFMYEFGTPASNTEIAFYVERFSTNLRYTVDDLGKDVQNELHKKTGKITEEFIEDFSGLTLEKKSVYSPPPFDTDALESFESKFQRPMYVQEYFKYVVMTTTGTGFAWSQIYADHTNAYNRMRETFETYTGKTISEYYFVNRFLFAIDDPMFFENIINDIVKGSEYKNGMCQVLADKYMAMFDVSMSESDTEYIFDIVKKQKLDIVNEKLVTILTGIKEETDNTISAIFKVYLGVLERPPDLDEITQYVNYYRNGGNDGEVEKVLMRTLEFHDSIKKKIKILYNTKKQKDVSVSTMFDILNRVIVKINELTMGTIDETILSLIA